MTSTLPSPQVEALLSEAGEVSTTPSGLGPPIVFSPAETAERESLIVPSLQIP